VDMKTVEVRVVQGKGGVPPFHGLRSSCRVHHQANKTILLGCGRQASHGSCSQGRGRRQTELPPVHYIPSWDIPPGHA
jgi:hypothetical protein